MMAWRQKILMDFQEPIPPLTLISDPDGLLLDEELLSELKKRRVELVGYQDAIGFRYLYEQKYRPVIAAGKFCLAVRTEEESGDVFPFDLIESGRLIKYLVTDLFPGLSAPVIRQLGTVELDELYAKAGEFQVAASNADTCDLILRKVFKIALDTVNSEVELLKLLLSKHYQTRVYPTLVEEYLIEQLGKKKALKEYPLANLIRSKEFFYQFLQQKWEDYLDEKKKTFEARENGVEGKYGTTQSNSLEDQDVRRLMDNLFTEGKLQPVTGYSKEILPEWAYIGIVVDPAADAKQRVLKLCCNLKERLQDDWDYRGWSQLAVLWGKVTEQVLAFGLRTDESVIFEVNKIEKQLDETFQNWLFDKFGSLKNLPYLPEPVMVHHIPHNLAAKHHGKTALLVLDGMSWVQWCQIRRHLRKKMGCEFRENSVFAWVPTITSISRQAIFTGEIPVYFAKSISTTGKEESEWKLFWDNHGVINSYTSYQKGLGKDSYPGPENLWKSTTKVVGLVIDMLDQLSHASLQGRQGLFGEIELWLQNGYLEAVISDLYQQGFEIFLTSDHGNKESRGIGTISQGVLAETRGERVRIYSDQNLMDQTAKEYNLITWQGDGLPDDMHVTLAPGNEAFVKKDDIVISHGSISIEEVIVPFVQLKWRE